MSNFVLIWILIILLTLKKMWYLFATLTNGKGTTQSYLLMVTMFNKYKHLKEHF